MGFMEMESSFRGKFQTKLLIGTFKTKSGILIILVERASVFQESSQGPLFSPFMSNDFIVGDIYTPSIPLVFIIYKLWATCEPLSAIFDIFLMLMNYKHVLTNDFHIWVPLQLWEAYMINPIL